MEYKKEAGTDIRRLLFAPAAFLSYLLPMNQLSLILALLVLSFGGPATWGEDIEDTALAEDTLVEAIEDSPRYVLSVQRVTVTDMSLNDTLMILLNSFGNPVAGFELKFAVESPFIDIDTVLPGEIYDSCQWQFFTSRPISARDKEGYPPLIWQAVGLAQSVLAGDGPVCYGLERQASLIKLVVSSGQAAQVPDTVAPIFFFWEDCTDNTIADISGATLSLSARVFDCFGNEFTPESDSFPNRTGAVDQCIDPAALNKPRRQIDFYNGGVEFKLDLGENIADSTEDSTE